LDGARSSRKYELVLLLSNAVLVLEWGTDCRKTCGERCGTVEVVGTFELSIFEVEDGMVGWRAFEPEHEDEQEDEQEDDHEDEHEQEQEQEQEQELNVGGGIENVVVEILFANWSGPFVALRIG
jgi:ABC-type Zn2+ transport system substrate-binding protein/surface adhesin